MRRTPRSAHLLTAAMALALVIPMVAVTAAGTEAHAATVGRDVALDGVATAKSEFPDPARFSASFVNDGDPTTRWGSDYTHGDEEPSYPHSDYDPSSDWVQIALAEPTLVHHVVLNWQTAYGREFDLQTSNDGVSWTTVHEERAGHEGPMRFDLDLTEPVEYVRMQGIVPSPWGYGMWSFEVWDGPGPGEDWEDPDPAGWDHGTDIAPAGTASASSEYSDQYAAAYLNDRTSTSRWGSNYNHDGNGFDPTNEWAQIELAEPSPVWSVRLNWETARPARFVIQTSPDGEAWTDVRTVLTPPTGMSEYQLGVSEPVRFVRMQGLATATVFGYSLFDFEVWSGPQAPPEPGGRVLPAPARMIETDDAPFALTQETRIIATDATLTPEAELLAADLRPATGFAVPVVTTGTPASGDVVLAFSPGDEESYTLEASDAGMMITGADSAGVFYGTRTLLQLLPAEINADTPQAGSWTVPAVTITDGPRYPHRGLMLDSARNFITVDGVKDTIDAIADMKGNRLHMHLTDDQGWRIEITSWPRLTEVGGTMSMPGGKSGFYTQEEFRDIVAYADARHIEVIPEVETPGHSSAAIAAYPELACGSTGTLCTTSPVVDQYLTDVLGELGAMSNSDLIHIGGDESISGQAYIDFIKKVEGIVISLDKRMVGWTPLPMAHLDPGSVHQYWRDQSREQEPYWWDNSNEVILSPTAPAYLDYPYPSHNSLTTHDWDPTSVVDDYLNVTLQSLGLKNENIIGIEGPIWAENNTEGDYAMQHKVFPRIAALLDLAWSPQERTADSRSFLDRLSYASARWQYEGTNFWPDPLVEWRDQGSGALITIGDDAVPAPVPVERSVAGTVGWFATATIPVESLAATIDWGDGTTTDGVLHGTTGAGKLANSLYAIDGEHTYTTPGTHHGLITLTGEDGATWNIAFAVVTPEPTEPSALDLTVVSRCVAAKVVLVASVENTGTEAVTGLAVTTPFGTRTVPELAGGRTTSLAVTTRLVETEAASATLTAMDSDGASIEVEEAYAGASCR